MCDFIQVNVIRRKDRNRYLLLDADLWEVEGFV